MSKIKGIHPGAILKRELKSRGLKSKELANLLDEHAQTISSIVNEKRGINPSLSIKLGRQFGAEQDYFMLLQASYDVEKTIEAKQSNTPDLSKIRAALFWDTDFKKIDWQKKQKAVIKRIFECGNDVEINEIISFYGILVVKNALKNSNNDFLPAFKHNLVRFKIINK
ncbi:HigA family addiction module antitoxin [Flavobacterium sp.]|uniref:HigA family addiction module antitoxin n=1 Tax=Flavobacterium sp. TaxID=239 RepID=UPI002609EBAB|nr:HigA family addiction module antitoxin [Flavobacterium sp.]